MTRGAGADLELEVAFLLTVIEADWARVDIWMEWFGFAAVETRLNGVSGSRLKWRPS